MDHADSPTTGFRHQVSASLRDPCPWAISIWNTIPMHRSVDVVFRFHRRRGEERNEVLKKDVVYIARNPLLFGTMLSVSAFLLQYNTSWPIMSGFTGVGVHPIAMSANGTCSLNIFFMASFNTSVTPA